jgi:hypothetical protein
MYCELEGTGEETIVLIYLEYKGKGVPVLN